MFIQVLLSHFFRTVVVLIETVEFYRLFYVLCLLKTESTQSTKQFYRGLPIHCYLLHCIYTNAHNLHNRISNFFEKQWYWPTEKADSAYSKILRNQCASFQSCMVFRSHLPCNHIMQSHCGSNDTPLGSVTAEKKNHAAISATAEKHSYHIHVWYMLLNRRHRVASDFKMSARAWNFIFNIN